MIPRILTIIYGKVVGWGRDEVYPESTYSHLEDASEGGQRCHEEDRNKDLAKAPKGPRPTLGACSPKIYGTFGDSLWPLMTPEILEYVGYLSMEYDSYDSYFWDTWEILKLLNMMTHIYYNFNYMAPWVGGTTVW